MIKILKLLFTILPLGNLSTSVAEIKNINLSIKNIYIEEHHLEKEPYYLLDDQKEKLSEIIRKNSSTIYRSKVNNFISLEELKLEHMKDFWYDSDLELNFKNVVERNSTGKSDIEDINFENLNFESFQLNINLAKRQESKVIEREYNYHDKWTDTFIYTKLDLEFKKIYGVNSGLIVQGTISEEILKDKVALKNKAWGERLGRIERGGLLLTNLKTNFISRRNYFQDIEENFYTLKTEKNSEYNYSRKKLEELLNSDDNFFKFLNIKKSNVYRAEIKTIFFANLFQSNLINTVVELKNNSQIIQKNIKVVFKGAEINTDFHELNLNYKSSLKNLDENHKKIKYFLSKKYSINENEIVFNLNDINNSKAIKSFEINKPVIFKYEYKKPRGKILTFNILISHTNIKSENNIFMLSWNQTKFETTSKNYELDNYSVISQSNIAEDDFDFKDIMTSFEKITLKKNETKELFIINGEKFRKVNYKYNDNIKVKNENENTIKISALKVGKSLLEIDSIDAKNKKVIEIEIINEDGYFELETNEIAIKKGEFDYIDLYSNSFEQLFIINKNVSLITIFEDNRLWIKSKKLGLFEIEIISNITKVSEKISIEIIENDSVIELDKNIVVSEVNTLNNLNIINFDEINENELSIKNLSKELLITREKNKIAFIPKSKGLFEIEFKYKKQNFTFKIYSFNEFVTREINTDSKKLSFNKNDYELKNYDNNINLIDLNGDYNFSLKDSNNIGNIEIVNKNGEYFNINISSKKESESNKDIENANNSKSKNKWTIVMAYCLIPITFGISLIIFLLLRKKLKKASL
ncbi:hypothetical protein [Spiroplasma endosymbiont of Cantharis rufa]|uniref:hypothetical protein n=1 Tax=Spiroplasma endosymbiont of Cantharis rufa TaxID=3066279 RepID=UPI0030CC074B